MSTDVVKYAFIAGELSPTLYGRGDLTKYDLGMAEAHNFFVDYRGGLSSRPGFQFCAHVLKDDKEVRLWPFVFSPTVENTYILVFGDLYIRFIQDGAYVLENPLTITGITTASPGVVTSVAHGLTAGRWVTLSGIVGMTELNGRTLQVGTTTANTFQLLDPLTGAAFSTTTLTPYVSGGTASAVYQIVSPYASSDLTDLTFDQYRDYLRITHRQSTFPPYDLVRADHTSWSITETTISEYKKGPTPSSSSASNPSDPAIAKDAQVLFAVSSVYPDGSESSIGLPFKVSGIVNYTVTEGAVSITWPADPEAASYKVYRSVVSSQEVLTYGSELGYVGRTFGTKFTDPNIIADFGKSPQNNYNPFSPGAILSISVTAGGTGYSEASVITMSGGGTGFSGYCVVNDSGGLVNVIIKSAGKNYVNPTISFGTGTGATATVTARGMTGTYPGLSAIYQQRQIYSSSLLHPITLWGSQYKRFENFSSSDFVLDSDSFEFDLDTAAITPIRHMLAMRGGLLVMTQDNVWLLNGGGQNQPLTPTNALADPQTYNGVSLLPPINVGSDMLYVEGNGMAVRLLNYNEFSRVYAGEDKSVLSNHLFGEGKNLTAWGYQENPTKTVWSVREDGVLLAFTIVKEEEVFAWTPCSTRGRFKNLVVVKEGGADRVYVVTERYVKGRWTKFVERQDLRTFVNVEDAWCVDCGLALGGTYPAATVSLSKINEVITATASAAVFSGALNKILRVGNGVFRVSAVTSNTLVTLEQYIPATNWVPETDEAYTFPVLEGSWTLDTPTTSIGGLWHLEGETVAILGDGNVFPPQTVVDGSITLPAAVSRCIVGLAFSARGKTLPMIVPDAGIEAKRKRIVGLAARLTRSRGLRYGSSYDRTYAMKERTTEAWGRPTALQEGIRYQTIGTTWDEEGQTYFRLDDPLPVTLLSLVSDIEVGDEPD